MRFNIAAAGAAVLSLLTTTLSTQAADIPRPVYKAPPLVQSYYNWTGVYVGAVGGYGWARSDFSAFGSEVRPEGAMAGGTIGYNYQFGAIVAGIEGDFSYSWADETAGCGAFACRTESRYFGTARARAGYAFDRFLPYVTGGLAYRNVRASSTALGFGLVSEDRFGFAVGGGVEYAIFGNLSAKIEYLYVDVGSVDFPAPGGNADFRENVVRAGLNYRFSGPLFSRF